MKVLLNRQVGNPFDVALQKTDEVRDRDRLGQVVVDVET